MEYTNCLNLTFSHTVQYGKTITFQLNNTVSFLASYGTDLVHISSKQIFWWTGDPVSLVGVPGSSFQRLMFEGYLIEISDKLAKIALHQWWL